MGKSVTELVKPSEEDNVKLMKIVEECGYCTVWELYKEYGIDKQKTCRYIRSGKLLAFMKCFQNKNGEDWREQKWYIVKNQALAEFIERHRKDKEIIDE